MFFVILFLTALLSASSQSILPPAIPLAVRSPYLQAYLPPYDSVGFHINWPNFWTTQHILGWCGLSRVDGKLYQWLGTSSAITPTNENASMWTTMNSFQITPTRTILSLQAGPVELTVTFLSPIEASLPSDLVLQSFPFTYIFVNASSTDGELHSVQLYEDITGEWNSFDITNEIRWNTTTANTLIYHEAQQSNPGVMIEDHDMAEDVVVYHVTTPGSGVTFQTGSSESLRNFFYNNGTLNGTQDTDYRAINDSWPVFAFSNDLGTISSTSSPVVWGIGVVRDPDIIYTTRSGNQTRRPYFFTKYPDAPTAMSDLMSNASNALQRSIALDDQIMSAANGISSNYTDLVSLASRQTLAGIEITAGIGSDGKLNESDVLFFMKDLGNSRRTNPIEVLYASLPALLYLNPTWIRYLLEPLLQFDTSELYSLPFTPIDLGDSFPSAIGNDSPSPLTAIESTSDMLIMLWAHATFTGDGSLLSQYYPTLMSWTNTLIANNPLIPNSYVSADTLDGTVNGLNVNMTNLAIKGIFAISTMAEISLTLGAINDYNNFSTTASSMLSQWQNLAAGPGHLTSTYSVPDSWSLLYNLYPDKLFGFNFVNQSIYDEQAHWYANIASTLGVNPYGMPFDSQFNAEGTSKSHWTLFTAATVTDPSTRDILVSMVYNSATDAQTYNVFPTTYSPSDNTVQMGRASPAQGAMFALLALNLTKHTITGFSPISDPRPTPASKKSKAGAIAGGIVGGAVLVALLAAFFFVCIRKYRQRRLDPDPNITPYVINSNEYLVTTHKNRAPYEQAPLLRRKVNLRVQSSRPPIKVRGRSSTPNNSGGTSDGAQDFTDLRGEVENIRRQIEEMRSGPYEAPPEYR